MSRIIIQLLLSVMVGVSAAVGFAPNAAKIRQEIKASLRERIHVALPAIGGATTQGGTNITVSTQTQVKSVITDTVKVNPKVKTSLNARVNSNVNSNGNPIRNNVNVSPQVSLNGSLNTSTQANAGVGTAVQGGINLKLRDEIKTNLNLNSALDLDLPLLP